MCFGSSDDDSSKEMIKMQKDEAARVAKNEADRQARITKGLSLISNMFKGAPVMKAVTKTAKTAGLTGKAGEGVAGLPAGYSYVKVPAASLPSAAAAAAAKTPTKTYSGGTLSGGGTASRSGPSGGNAGQQSGGFSSGVGASGSPSGGGHSPGSNQAASVAPTALAIQGPDGKIYEIGSDIAYGAEEDTGEKTGQWQDKFFNDYKQKILDYYNPQVTEQLGEAKDETTYRLARAGTLASTGGIMSAADLEKQKLLREGEVASKADTAAADLKNRVAKEQTAAEAQLYATENPEVAANQATAAIQNITAETPDLSPLAEIFNIATIGGANLYKGASNASRMAGGYGSSSQGRNQKTIFS